jgi:2-oxoglutarate dehydrogenase E2 component (dihydrolipoamide succinyltransferase)
MPTVINMPSLGESVTEGEVGKWLVKEGDRIEKDAPLVEIMTDKADSPVYAPESGVITKIFVREGATVSVGDKLAELEPGASAQAKPSAPPAKEAPKEAPKEARASRAPEPARAPEAPAAQEAMASPAIRKLAREQNVDLAKLGGSGTGGRITKDDVLRAASSAGEKSDGNGPQRAAVPPPSNVAREAKETPQVPFGPKGYFKLPPYQPVQGDEVVPFSRRRRIIADHMVFSKLTAPHVVTFAECDLHKVAALREAHKNEYKAAGLNLTYLAFVCAATVKALEEFPELNARVLDDAYVKLREINLGIAVDTPEGLVVPVIRNADELSLRGLARSIEELAQRARDNQLVPDDLAGKTFAISNPGRKGNLVGGAIISQPNVGILRIGEIKKRVVVVEHEGEDLMAIRPVMYMALSYDHRIVDGVHANGFLWRINELLEKGEFEA